MEMCSRTRSILVATAVAAAVLSLAGANVLDDFAVDWAPQNVRFAEDGRGVSLQLDRSAGCRIRTKTSFLYLLSYSWFQVTRQASFQLSTYTSSEGRQHDEIDFEFLGNAAGQPYTIHTNMFVAAMGNREVQFKPWFDPTTGFHNYTISWSPCMIVWFVDGVPIRLYKNSQGVAFPSSQQMSGFMSIWASTDAWATQGGRVRTDWSKAPFVSNYRDIRLPVNDDFPAHSGPCELNKDQMGHMQEIQGKYMLYNYCHDSKRFNGQMPGECKQY
ncbi:hypothetical protein EJB05_24254, partial [Eragrostis curvula]